ncbi:MAG: hypothetical protein WCG95_00200 [bacterium]
MLEEAMKFEELIGVLHVIDKGDKMKPLNKAIQQEYENLVQKINEYNTGGELIIKLKFVIPKDTKNEIEIVPEVTSKEPKRSKRNRLYRDGRAAGIFIDNPDQLHIVDVRKINSDGEKKKINSKI